MSKNLIFLTIFFSFFSLILSQDIQEEEISEDFYYDNYDGEQYFKEIVKDYLIEKNLWKSEKLIQPEELRKIFIDIIMDGEDYKNGKLKDAFDKLVDYFIDKYYKDKKEIRGKDIYDLIGVTEISLKFEELVGDKKYDEEEDEDDQYDNMDIVGDPNVDF
jgi:hypothetical protein